jgi:hypothetical protein
MKGGACGLYIVYHCFPPSKPSYFTTQRRPPRLRQPAPDSAKQLAKSLQFPVRLQRYGIGLLLIISLPINRHPSSTRFAETDVQRCFKETFLPMRFSPAKNTLEFLCKSWYYRYRSHSRHSRTSNSKAEDPVSRPLLGMPLAPMYIMKLTSSQRRLRHGLPDKPNEHHFRQHKLRHHTHWHWHR